MPRGAAQLVVEFVADASRLQAEVSKVEGMSGRLKSFGKKAAIGIGGAFAADKALEFGKATVDAARESELAHNRLQAVFAATGETTGQAAAAAEDYASKLSMQIGVDDEIISAGQAKLATFKSVSSEAARQAGIFDRATAAGADLAAAGFGSIESNATMLGKALENPTKGLAAMARVGVTFTDQQKAQIEAMVKSGDTLGAQKAILAGVEGQVKGTAAATATSTDKMKVGFEEAQEQLGSALTPALDALAQLLTTTLVPALTAILGWFEKNKAAMLLLVPVAVALAAAFLGISWPITGIIAGIALVSAALLYAYKNWDWFRKGVQIAVRAVILYLTPLILTIKLVVKVVQIAARFIIQHWSTISGAARAVFSVVNAVWRRIVAVVRGAVGGIGSAVGAIGRFFARVGSAAASAFHAVSNWFGRIVGFVRGVIGGVSSAVSGIVNALKGPINAVIGAMNRLHIPQIKLGGNKVGPYTLPAATFGPWTPFHIPKLARGGILTSPTLFLGGESGTEIVAPESLMRSIVREERAPLVAQLNVQAWNPVAVAAAVADELAYLEVRRR